MDKIKVRNGIDQIERYDKLLGGKRLGLITGPTGVNKHLRSTIDLLNERYHLTALYSPEHGIRGNVQAGVHVDTYIDEKTGIQVYSLYGKNKKPSPEMLKDMDMMVMDIQDVGARYYTYLYTMIYGMKSCAENGKSFVVLDRINPIGGNVVEGNILDPRSQSFVGLYPVASRYGLTIGEFATFINQEFHIHCDLHVVRCEGWRREVYFDQTDLLWIPPSPNIPTIDTAVLYPGTCMFEGTNISEGRGTTKPFEMIGAPWLDPDQLADRMNDKALRGVAFRPVYFEPAFSKHKGELCKGVQVHITDRSQLEGFKIGLHLLREIQDMSANKFAWLPPFKEGTHYFIDLLMGTDEIRLGGFDVGEIMDKYAKQIEDFKKLKARYHVYE